jgi:transcriptional regulator with XRE-family HTH domain
VTVLVHGPGSEDLLPQLKGLNIVRRPDPQLAERALNVFVLVTATDLPAVAEFVTRANRRHRLRALFIREETDPRWLPQWFERAGLRTLRNTLVHSGPTLPRRVLAAWLHGAQGKLIADASVVADRLFLVTCALDRYEITFGQVPALKAIPEAERARFEVDEDGSHLHWPGPDIHIDIDAIRSALDPIARAESEAAKATRNRRYGAAIAKLRTASGLTQSDIEGLSERHVRRIEKGEGASAEALRRFAVAHKLSLNDYLRDIAALLAPNAKDSRDDSRIVSIEDDTEFREFQRTNQGGLAMVPELYGDLSKPVLRGSGGDFAKWLRMHAPAIPVEVRRSEHHLVLRSGDYWLPLVFLAKDLAISLYLRFVSGYIRDQTKGALKGDTTRVRFSVVYEDRRTDSIKRFDFDGDAETLQLAIEQFNTDE